MATAPVDDLTNTPTEPIGRTHPTTQAVRGAYMALGLLLAMNLFNYIDRMVLAAVEPQIRRSLFPGEDPDGSYVKWKSGLLASAFLVSYMLTAPIFGALAQRFSRWKLIALGVLIWSLATGAGGLASTFLILFITRCVVGVGEGAFGPLAPAILSDCFPVSKRGKILSWFYVAMPVGSALGFAVGAVAAHWDPAHESWRWAFYIVVIPGLLLALLSFMMRELPVGAADAVTARRRMTWRDCSVLLKTPSFVFDTLGMTAMSFAMGALAWWTPDYLESHHVPQFCGIEPGAVFGVILLLAGLCGTLAGGALGDRLRERAAGSYFLVSGWGLLISAPCVLLFLVAPFPWAWAMIFLAVFFMFLNTGPTNAILANVVHPVMRPAGFALNIFVIHILGDVISPPIIGAVSGHWNLSVGFGVVSAFLAIGGLLWLYGGRYLKHDTEIAPNRM